MYPHKSVTFCLLPPPVAVVAAGQLAWGLERAVADIAVSAVEEVVHRILPVEGRTLPAVAGVGIVVGSRIVEVGRSLLVDRTW